MNCPTHNVPIHVYTTFSFCPECEKSPPNIIPTDNPEGKTARVYYSRRWAAPPKLIHAIKNRITPDNGFGYWYFFSPENSCPAYYFEIEGRNVRYCGKTTSGRRNKYHVKAGSPILSSDHPKFPE